MAMQGDLKVRSDGRVSLGWYNNGNITSIIEAAVDASDKLERKRRAEQQALQAQAEAEKAVRKRASGSSLIGEMIHLIKKGDTIYAWRTGEIGAYFKVEEIFLHGLRVSLLKSYATAEELEDFPKNNITVSLDWNFKFFWTKEDQRKFFHFDNLKSQDILPIRIQILKKANRRASKQFLKKEVPCSNHKKRKKKLRTGVEARRHKEMFLW